MRYVSQNGTSCIHSAAVRDDVAGRLRMSQRSKPWGHLNNFLELWMSFRIAFWTVACLFVPLAVPLLTRTEDRNSGTNNPINFNNQYLGVS